MNQSFSIGEAAKFLDRSIYWIREAERVGDFTDEKGRPIVPERTPTTNSKMGQRRYTLDNIEAMAESLFRQEKFDKHERDRVLQRVAAFRI